MVARAADFSLTAGVSLACRRPGRIVGRNGNRSSCQTTSKENIMRIGIIGLAAGLLLAGSAATLAATGPVAGDITGEMGTVARLAPAVAAAPSESIVIARRGADDPPGDDRGGRGRGKDDKNGKGKDDKGGKNKGKGKGRGGKDDGPNHDRNDDHGNHGPNHT
jgi:hypothetical protein